MDKDETGVRLTVVQSKLTTSKQRVPERFLASACVIGVLSPDRADLDIPRLVSQAPYSLWRSVIHQRIEQPETRNYREVNDPVAMASFAR